MSCGWRSELSHIPEWLKSVFFFWHFVQLAWTFALCQSYCAGKRVGHSHLQRHRKDRDVVLAGFKTVGRLPGELVSNICTITGKIFLGLHVWFVCSGGLAVTVAR